MSTLLHSVSRPLRRALAASMLASLLPPAFAGCGSGSSGPPPPPPASIRFVPTSAAPPANSLTLQQASVTSTTLTLNVVATGVNNVASVFFDVVYSPAPIACTGAAAGPFLASGGGTVSFLLPPDVSAACAAGRLPVGISITPAVTGVSGTGVVATITLTSAVSGSTAISLENAGLRAPLAVPIPGVVFAGGDIFVTR
jgi:hypothetical protein